MLDVLDHVDRIIERWSLPWTRSGNVVDVQFPRSGRHQRVWVKPRERSVHFQSIAASAGHVRQSDQYWRELALRAWRKNAAKELVGFAFDKRDRLVGCADHPGTHLADRDLRTYIEVLARECDHFEFLLSGEDRA